MSTAGFTLRPATAQDFDSIRQLIQRVDINSRGLEWQYFIVAVDAAGSLLGCGQVKSHPGEVLELASIATQPAHRGRGIASAIILELLAQHQGETLYLMTESAMDRFYAKFGFHRIEEDEMPRYFRRMVNLPGFVELFTKDGLQVIVMKR